MRLNPRQRKLLDEIALRQSAGIDELARLLGVTAQTVRRDSVQLAQAGLLSRFHGGVSQPAGSTIENIAYGQRQALNAEGKRRIARAIASDIPNGCSLILNIGTTTEAVAHALLNHRDLKVVTNSLNVAAILADSPGCEVLVAGGSVRARDHGVVGEATVDFIRQFRADIAVIGISSIEADGTLRDFDYREVKVAQAVIEQSREVWLAADHGKFSRRALVQLAHLSQVDVLYTDAPPPEAQLRMLTDAGGRCVTVD